MARDVDYQRVLDTMREGCQIIGFDWRYLYVNATAVHDSRQPREALLGHTVMQCYPGIEESQLFAALLQCMTQRTAHDGEYPFAYGDGSQATFEFRIEPVPEGLLVLTLEIPKHQEAKATFRSSAANYQLLADNIADVVWTMDAQTRRFTYVSPSVKRLLGYTVEELLAQPLETVITPAGLAMVRLELPARLQALAVGDPAPEMNTQTYTLEQRHKDGSLVWTEVVTTLLTDSAGVVQILGITRDITDRKLAEVELAHHTQSLEEMHRFLQATLDAFPANAAVLDPDGTIIKANLTWIRFADENDGHSATHYVGDNYLTVCDQAVGAMSAEAAPAAAGIRAVIAGEQEEFSLEYPCASTEQMRWFILRVTPFAEPAPRRVLVAHINITEQEQAERAEREQRLLAESLRDSVAVLTSSLDVETVMQRILAYSASVIPSEAGAIILFEGDQGRVACSRGFSTEAEAYYKSALIPLQVGTFARRYEDQESYLAPNIETVTEWVVFPFTDWIRSSIGVPIVVHGESIGLLTADSRIPNHFQQKDVDNLQAFALYAALALENAQSFDQLERRVQARTAELQAAKERVEAILNNSADGILLVDSDFTIRQTNAALHTLFASPANAYLNQPLVSLFAAQAHELIATTLQMGVTSKRIVSIEARARRMDGSEFDAEVRMRFLNDQSMVCNIHDITERKQAEEAVQRSEERYRLLAENVSDVILKLNPRGYLTFLTPSCSALYGYAPAELLGRYSGDFMHPDDVVDSKANMVHANISMQSSFKNTHRIRHKDGHYLWVEATTTLIRDPQSGVTTEYISVLRDITARKQIETALREALAQEKELGELKSRFVSMASHEFRTPLATILASAETLGAFRHEMAEVQIDRRLQNIRNQVDHLKEIIDDVLQLARMQAHRIDFNPSVLDLDELCRSVIDELRETVSVAHDLRYENPHALHQVKLDPKLMRQIITNLVSNAIKYSAAGTAIKIMVKRVEESIVLVVSDQGFGIPEADLKHVFEPFHRGANVGTISGTGLGLSIVKEAVDLHSGEITIESRLDAGTTVMVTIPPVT